MVELEADDALATAAARAAAEGEVERVVICTPDKDLAQCVTGRRVVQLDRRAERIRDEDGVRERFGVRAGLDPRLPRAGGRHRRRLPRPARLGRQERRGRAGPLRAPRRDPAPTPATGTCRCAGAARLARALAEGRELAELFRVLATLRTDAAGVLEGGAEELRWRGPAAGLREVCDDLDAPDVLARAEELAASRG